ncbi:MAG TPA: Plug domain-containing protein [Microthrixaceae bacterium]|nr:Plug domain-containing protein [Microthrixaceae bacterium]
MLAALASGAAQALSERELLGDLPVVFSVARMPQPQQEAPGMVTVLDRETIRASGYRNLPDLLRLAPGFQVAWLRGWWGVATYHGLAGEFSNRVLVLVDGRPVNSEYWSQGIDWQSLPVAIDDVDRIEVLGGLEGDDVGRRSGQRRRPTDDAVRVGESLVHGIELGPGLGVVSDLGGQGVGDGLQLVAGRPQSVRGLDDPGLRDPEGVDAVLEQDLLRVGPEGGDVGVAGGGDLLAERGEPVGRALQGDDLAAVHPVGIRCGLQRGDELDDGGLAPGDLARDPLTGVGERLARLRCRRRSGSGVLGSRRGG